MNMQRNYAASKVLMNSNYQPVRTRPPTLQRNVAPSPLSLTGQKFCVCKATFDQETQYGDIQCDLCQQPFHATCVGASPTEQFTCSPCHQKHTSARSTCICHSFDGKNGLLVDRNAELNWCSCDVCQTWFHENCVSSEKTFVRLPNKDEISFMCTKCSQADLEIVNGPMTLSKLQLTEQIYSKFKNSRHSWPLKRKDIVCRIQTNMGFIESKLNQKLYKTFKQFMDEVFYCINFFREHYASTSAPESSFSNTKKEVKCCEILEYDFSYLIREFIAKERHKSAFVILPESHAKIEENERAINAGMSSGAAANIFP